MAKRQRREKPAKIEKKLRMEIPFLFIFWVGPPSLLEGVLYFVSPIKLSYNTGPPVTSNFCCSKTELGKLYTALTEKQGISRKTSTCCSLTTLKPLCRTKQSVENSLGAENTRSPYLFPEKPVCKSRRPPRKKTN